MVPQTPLREPLLVSECSLHAEKGCSRSRAVSELSVHKELRPPAESSTGGRILSHLRVLPAAAFLSVINDVYATSFGMLLLPRTLGLDASMGVPIYLLSVLSAQVAASLSSKVHFAAGGSCYELLPMLVPMVETVLSDPSLDDAARASNVLALFSLTSALIGVLYLVAARLRMARIFRCVPLVVLKGALTSVGLFMVSTAISMVAGGPVLSLSALSAPELWPRLLTTLLLAAGLGVTDALVPSPLATMTFLLAATLAFGVRACRPRHGTHTAQQRAHPARHLLPPVLTGVSSPRVLRPRPCQPWTGVVLSRLPARLRLRSAAEACPRRRVAGDRQGSAAVHALERARALLDGDL